MQSDMRHDAYRGSQHDMRSEAMDDMVPVLWAVGGFALGVPVTYMM